MGELCGACRGSKTREKGRFMDAKGMKRRTHPFRGQQSGDRRLSPKCARLTGHRHRKIRFCCAHPQLKGRCAHLSWAIRPLDCFVCAHFGEKMIRLCRSRTRTRTAKSKSNGCGLSRQIGAQQPCSGVAIRYADVRHSPILMCPPKVGHKQKHYVQTI